jgi:hypothetical protein
MKSEPIQFRTDPENKRRAELMAKSYEMTVSAYLRMLVNRDYLKYASVGLVPQTTPEESAIESVAE